MNRARSGERGRRAGRRAATSGRRSVRHCSSSSLRRRTRNPVIDGPTSRGRTKPRPSRSSDDAGPTSSRNTSSRVGRACSNETRTTPAATTSGQDLARRPRRRPRRSPGSCPRRRPRRSPTAPPAGVAARPVTASPWPGAGHEHEDRPGVGLEQVGERALRHEPAAIEDRDAVADPLDVGEDVGRDDHRRGPAEPLDQLEQVPPALGVERADRLVEDQQIRLVDERPGRSRAAAASRRCTRRSGAPPASARPVRLSISATRDRSSGPSIPPSRPDSSSSSRPFIQRVEPRVLVEIADPPAELGPVEPDVDAGHGRGPAGRPGEAGQDPDRRRLAGAVGAEQAEDRAGAARRGRASRARGPCRTAWSGRGPGSRLVVAAACRRRRGAASRLLPPGREVDDRPDHVDEHDDQRPDELAAAADPALVLLEVDRGPRSSARAGSGRPAPAAAMICSVVSRFIAAS